MRLRNETDRNAWYLRRGPSPSDLTFCFRGGESGRVFTPLASPMLDSLALASSSGSQVRESMCWATLYPTWA